MSIKKRIVYFVLILIVSFSFAGNVFAEEFSAKLNYSNTVISKGDIASFKIELKSSEIIAECLLKIENGSNLEW